MKQAITLLTVGLAGCLCAVQPDKVAQWDIFELSLEGSAAGNPFVGLEFSATFENGGRQFEPEGFYDGEGMFKIRFMPDARRGVQEYLPRKRAFGCNPL